MLVLDERLQSGGQFYKPLAPSHRAATPPDRQFADGLALEREVLAAGVTVQQGAQVWAAFSPREVSALIDGRATNIRCRQLVIAPGAYERPVPFPGWTLPGVMTTGAAQTLARAYRVAPGRRVVIAGNGPLNLQLAAELLAGGAEVVAVLESAARPAAARLAPAADGRAHRARPAAPGLGLPAHAARPQGAGAVGPRGGRGRRRGRAAVRAGRDAAIRGAMPRLPAALRFEADTLCLGYGFIPSTELARMLGCEHRVADRHLGYLATVTGPDGATSLPGVFVVGDGADMGGSRVALARGTLAGVAAARNLGLLASDPFKAQGQLRQAECFQQALWSLYEAPPVALAAVQRRHAAVPLRGDQLRLGARADPRRPRHAGRAEAQHAAGHGPLPGPLLRGHGGASWSAR